MPRDAVSLPTVTQWEQRGARDGDVADFDIRMLGRFRVYRDGVELVVPQGHAASVFQILVLNAGVVHRDMLIAQLWPDDPADVGRGRLRNVLTRVRQDLGANIEARAKGTDTVTLLDRFRCDLIDYIRDARRAIAGLDGRRQSYRLCMDLQARWTGPPLEDSRYEPWAESTRQLALDLHARIETMFDTMPTPGWSTSSVPQTED